MENKEIKEIKKEMLSQNNAATVNPIFVVYEDKEYPTTSDYGREWSYMDLYDGSRKIGQTKESLVEYYNDMLNDGTTFDEELSKEDIESFSTSDMFEWLKGNSEHCKDYLEEIYYFIVERFVSVFFTRKAAESFIKQNHYHYTNPHIYVNSLWRNYEMQEIRNHLLKYGDEQ